MVWVKITIHNKNKYFQEIMYLKKSNSYINYIDFKNIKETRDYYISFCCWPFR